MTEWYIRPRDDDVLHFGTKKSLSSATGSLNNKKKSGASSILKIVKANQKAKKTGKAKKKIQSATSSTAILNAGVGVKKIAYETAKKNQKKQEIHKAMTKKYIKDALSQIRSKNAKKQARDKNGKFA